MANPGRLSKPLAIRIRGFDFLAGFCIRPVVYGFEKNEPRRRVPFVKLHQK
jgi:hypothetical protein